MIISVLAGTHQDRKSRVANFGMASATGEDFREYVVLAFHTFGHPVKGVPINDKHRNTVFHELPIAMEQYHLRCEISQRPLKLFTRPTRQRVLSVQGLVYALNKRSSPREGTDDVNARVR